MDKTDTLPLLATDYQLSKLKESLRYHRQVDATRALRDLIGLGLSKWRDDYPDEHPNVPLKTCVDIVRAIDALIPSPEPEAPHDEVNAEWVVCLWDQGEQHAYRYFDYDEALQDADRLLNDKANAMVSVAKVVAYSKITRTMVKV